jgi:hypothetical protein
MASVSLDLSSKGKKRFTLWTFHQLERKLSYYLISIIYANYNSNRKSRLEDHHTGNVSSSSAVAAAAATSLSSSVTSGLST